MEEKKSPKANLENKKLMFVQIGLIISLAAAWAILEVKSYDKREASDLSITNEIIYEEDMMATQQEEPPKPEPVEVPKQSTILEVVENDVEVEDVEINAEVDLEEEIQEAAPVEIEQEEEEEIEEPFLVVEDNPEFPGGMAKLADYLTKNIKYPPMARDAGIQGKVIVNFVVEKDGSVSNVKVLRGIGGGCDEEAIRIVKSMPKWKAGMQRGRPVRVYFNLPVNFVLTKG